MSHVKGSRSYSSPRREAAARATRRAVIDAAHRRFAAQGYAATTIEQIAETAEVSRPTVYAVGAKAELLKLVRDVAIAGDDEPIAVPERQPVEQMKAAPDPEATLRLHARNVAAINRRYVEVDEVLRQAAGADPELRRLWRDAEQQRHDGASIVIDNVLEKGDLKPGLERNGAVDVLLLLMAPDHLRRLRDRGWDDTSYQRWLADTFVSQLLPTSATRDDRG